MGEIFRQSLGHLPS